MRNVRRYVPLVFEVSNNLGYVWRDISLTMYLRAMTSRVTDLYDVYPPSV